TGGRDVMLGVQDAKCVAARNEHQRAVELVDLIKEDRHIHGTSLRHEVIVLPGTVVLVPLPEIALEGHLAVDLELMHVHRLTKDLHYWLDHARMAGESGERRAVHMRGEVGAHRVAALLADILRAVLGVESRYLVDQDPDLHCGKQTGE